MTEPARLDLEHDWAPVGRGLGIVPALVGLACLVGSSLLVSAVFPFLVVLLVGLTSLGFGIALLVGRAGVRLDRDAATVTRWWGLPAPMWRRVAPLPRATQVTVVGRQESRGRNLYWRPSIELPGSQPVTLYVKNVRAGWRHVGGAGTDSYLSKAERDEILANVHGLAQKVGSYLGVPVRSQVPPEITGDPR